MMSHQQVALVRTLAMDLHLAEESETKSAQSAAAHEAERKIIAVQLARARDEITMSNSTHETQQNASSITIADLETRCGARRTMRLKHTAYTGSLLPIFDHAMPPRGLRSYGELVAVVQSHEAKLLERQQHIDSLVSTQKADSDAHERTVRG